MNVQKNVNTERRDLKIVLIPLQELSLKIVNFTVIAQF